VYKRCMVKLTIEMWENFSTVLVYSELGLKMGSWRSGDPGKPGSKHKVPPDFDFILKSNVVPIS